MARKKPLEQPEFVGAQPGEMFAEPSPDTIPALQDRVEEWYDEQEKVYALLNSFKEGDTDAKAYLHRGDAKRKGFVGAFIQTYPVDVDVDAIYEEARDNFGGGDFCIVVRQGSKVVGRQLFSVEPRAKVDSPLDSRRDSRVSEEDPLDRLAKVAEKSLVVQRTMDALHKGEPKGSGDGNQMLLTMLTAMMQQQGQVMTALLTRESGGSKGGGIGDMIEVLKLGHSLGSGAPLPSEGGDDWMDMAKAFGTAVAPAVAGMLQPNRPTAPSPVAQLPAHPAGAGNAPAPAPAQKPSMEEIVRNRILNEIVFNAQQGPGSPEVFDHIIEYANNYAPAMLEQALIVDGETFATFLSAQHPALKDKKPFLLALHAHLLADSEPDTDG